MGLKKKTARKNPACCQMFFPSPYLLPKRSDCLHQAVNPLHAWERPTAANVHDYTAPAPPACVNYT
jgi:hypothetical protein